MTNCSFRVFSVIFFILYAVCSNAAEIGPGDDFEAAAMALSPGAELVLRGGIYTFNENITVSVSGTSTQSITIRSKDGEKAILEQSSASHNVIEVNNASWLVLRGLVIRGGSQGLRLINSDYITIEDCEIYETGDVALSANSGGTYEGLVIRRNHIHHTNGTGEGMYLGCNYDGCRIANSVIEGNYIHHTNRSSVEQGDGIEIKEGSYGNIIRNNVVHDTNYPCILLYSTVGNGAPNIVEGNIVWNSSDNTIQVAADAIIRNNIVLGNVSFQTHQSGSPSNIEFVHNTVINSGRGVQVSNISGPVLIANNAVYAPGGAISLNGGNLGLATLAGNVGTGGLSGASSGYTEGNGINNDMVSADYSGAPPIDPYPTDYSAMIGAGDPNYGIPIDFNGTPRIGSTDAGAYHYQPGGNPGWTITGDFKGEPTLLMPPTNLRFTD
jgi:hypothetical protein